MSRIMQRCVGAMIALLFLRCFFGCAGPSGEGRSGASKIGMHKEDATTTTDTYERWGPPNPGELTPREWEAAAKAGLLKPGAKK